MELCGLKSNRLGRRGQIPNYETPFSPNPFAFQPKTTLLVATQYFAQNGGGSASPLRPNSITEYAAMLTLTSQTITNDVVDL